MDFKLNICIAVLNRYDLCKELIDSCEQGTVKPDHYFILDNGMKLNNYSTMFGVQNITVFTPPEQWALAKCWNFFMNKFVGINFILNDDIELAGDSLEKIKDTYINTDNDFIGMVNSDNYMSGFSAFVVKPECYNDIGEFDEKLYPAYYEDCDYWYRMMLKNKKATSVNTNFIHKGSSTSKGMCDEERQKLSEYFMKNQNYYKEKWGGLNGQETFKTPFNE